jgi:hypothetical protein
MRATEWWPCDVFRQFGNHERAVIGQLIVSRHCATHMDSSFPFHGDLEAPDGLLPLADCLASCPWPIRVVRSSFDGTLYLKARQADVELQMDSGQHRSFHFSGAVDGTREHAIQRMTEFSDRLKQAGVVHSVELYEQPPPTGGVLVAEFSHPERT